MIAFASSSKSEKRSNEDVPSAAPASSNTSRDTLLRRPSPGTSPPEVQVAGTAADYRNQPARPISSTVWTLRTFGCVSAATS
jgi:hypothetical protein